MEYDVDHVVGLSCILLLFVGNWSPGQGCAVAVAVLVLECLGI